MTREKHSTSVDLIPDRMKEREVRESIDRCARHAREIAEKRGEGVQSTEQFRKQFEQCAEIDRQKGKI